MAQRKAGEFLMDLLTNENTEDIAEALLLAGFTASTFVGSDAPVEQILLNTGLAGTGALLGNKLGKPIGAGIGKAIYDKPIEGIPKELATGIYTAGSGNTLGVMQKAQRGELRPSDMVPTGEHIGRLVGRIGGDEVGSIAGVMAGNVIAQNMGWESEEDRMVRKLKDKVEELENG